MKKKLIVVADDFGFSEAYNYGVIKAYKEGIVTVASLMSNMAAAKHAVDLAKEYPGLCLAQHTNFVQGFPVSKAEEVPSMVDETCEFYRSYQWAPVGFNAADKCKGTVVVSYEDAKKETIAQLNRFKELVGEYPIHFEGHSVITPNIEKAFNEVSEEYHLHCMTTKEENDDFYYAHELVYGEKGEFYINAIQSPQGQKVEDFINSNGYGLLESPYEYNVMHFHPGYLDAYVIDHTSLTIQRCRDLQVLTSPQVKEWIKAHDIELVNFNALRK